MVACKCLYEILRVLLPELSKPSPCSIGQLPRCTFFNNLAPFQNKNSIAKIHHHVQAMRDHDDGVILKLRSDDILRQPVRLSIKLRAHLVKEKNAAFWPAVSRSHAAA